MNQVDNKPKFLFSVYSDIHLEFLKDKQRNKFYSSLKKNNEGIPHYCFLAGDIGYPKKSYYDLFIKHCSKIFDKTFVVAGNHEYYNKTKNENPYSLAIGDSEKFIKPAKTMFAYSISNIDQYIQDVCNRYNNVYFLNNNFIKLDEFNVTIIGSTLWSNVCYDDNALYVQYAMNDYNKIFIEKNDNTNYKRNITIHDIDKIYHNNVQYLENKLTEINNDIIIITHHLPSLHLLKYDKDRTKYAYASNCEFLFNDKIKYWIYGHAHGANVENYRGINFINNSVGYPNQYTKYVTTSFAFY
jgi:predicted phosphohydrolase